MREVWYYLKANCDKWEMYSINSKTPLKNYLATRPTKEDRIINNTQLSQKMTEEEKKEQWMDWTNKKHITRLTDLYLIVSIITLNVNGVNTLIKRRDGQIA